MKVSPSISVSGFGDDRMLASRAARVGLISCCRAVIDDAGRAEGDTMFD